MVEADSHLKPLPPSILETYKVIEHIDMLFKGTQYQPCTLIPSLLGSGFGVPHKSQKLIYKNKLLQIVQVIASNCFVIISEFCLFYLAVTFNVVNNIYCFK